MPSDFMTTKRLTKWAPPVAVFLLALICYGPALQGELLWDDPAHVTKPELRSMDGLGRIWTDIRATQQYYPVLHTAFWIEQWFWGDSTFGYHLINILLHATACCLFAGVLRQLWAKPPPNAGPDSGTRCIPKGTEWIAALILVVHPVCVESVAWISEQKNTLSLVFYLLAARAYLRFDADHRRRDYALATGFFLLALGTKTVTATLPAALWVVAWWRRGRLDWKTDIRPLLPWFAVALIAGLSTAWIEANLIGAEGDEFDLNMGQRVLLAGRVVWFYLGSLLWPSNLAFFYERWDVASDASGWWGYLIAAAVVTGMFWVVRKKSRGPLAAWLLFVGALFPALGFVNVFPFSFSYVADHFQYLANLSLIAAVPAGVALFWDRTSRLAQIGILSGFVGMVLTMTMVTRGHAHNYVSNEALFTATVERSPGNWMAHRCLGWALSKIPGRDLEAIEHYRLSLNANPLSPDTHHDLAAVLSRFPEHRGEAVELYHRAIQLRPHFAEAHLGYALEIDDQPDRLEEAIEHFEASLLTRPDHAATHFHLAKALAQIPSRTPEAFSHYMETLRIEPDHAEAHNGLGILMSEVPNRVSEAMSQFQAALQSAPDYAEAHFNLANLLAGQPDRLAEAVVHYEHALRLKPGVATTHFNLANTLALISGRMPEAVIHFEAALALKPDSPEILVNLGNALTQFAPRIPDAITCYEQALRLNPDMAVAHQNLAQLLVNTPGRGAEAIHHAEQAVRIQSTNPDVLNTLAIIHAQLGNLNSAKLSWQKALELEPNFTTARENLKRLEQMLNP